MMDEDGVVTVKTSRGVNFSGVVSLGNVLIIVGMVSTGTVGIYTIGAEVRGLQDQIVHETEMRNSAVHELAQKVDGLAIQESRDIQAIQQSLSDVREDVRSLVTNVGIIPAKRR